MSRHPSVLLVLVASIAGTALACGSSTAPANLTGPYVGTYAMDSVSASVLQKEGVPNGTLDSADGVQGTLTLKPDSFYIVLTGTVLEALEHTSTLQDSGTFTISSSNQWTLGGSLFSGTGSGALVGNQLQLTLTGGTALGNLYGLFTKQ
jgi:hypothetical protein